MNDTKVNKKNVVLQSILLAWTQKGYNKTKRFFGLKHLSDSDFNFLNNIAQKMSIQTLNKVILDWSSAYIRKVSLNTIQILNDSTINTRILSSHYI